MPKVVLTVPLSQQSLRFIRSFVPPEVQFEVVSTMSDAELIGLADGAEALLNITLRKLGSNIFEKLPHLRFIQQLGVGYDSIDIKAAAAAGIIVSNTPGVNTRAVAEQTVLLILAMLKNMVAAESSARQGNWIPTKLSDNVGDLAGKTVGLVGFGAIAKATAARLLPFECPLIYYTRHPVEAEAMPGLVYRDLPDLLTEADIVSLHMSLNPETARIIGEKELAMMKPGSYLVNTGRGGLVDEKALQKALESGHLAGAAMDVIENERQGGNPFGDLPQVIVTPHIGGASQDSVRNSFRAGLENLNRYLSGQTPLNRVN